MNTERPENDDTGADGSAEEQVAGQEKGTDADAAGAEAPGGGAEDVTSVSDAGDDAEGEIQDGTEDRTEDGTEDRTEDRTGGEHAAEGGGAEGADP
ncbi:hypothetical protein ABZZ80_22155, partial [Streptomyces sp. NPDC006356]